MCSTDSVLAECASHVKARKQVPLHRADQFQIGRIYSVRRLPLRIDFFVEKEVYSGSPAQHFVSEDQDLVFLMLAKRR